MTLAAAEIPFQITSPFTEPAEFAAFRAAGGPVKVRTSTGHVGWLVSGYSDLTALCADHRIGRSHRDPASAARLWPAQLMSPGGNHQTEMTDHRLARQHLSRPFGPRSVGEFVPRMREILNGQLDELVRAAQPADLIAQLVTPFVARAVFEFAGIPPQDWASIQAWSHEIRLRRGQPGSTSRSQLRGYVRGLLELKKHGSGADALSAAARSAVAADGDVRATLDRVCALNVTDYDVLAARLGYGLLFLLWCRPQLQLLLSDRSLVTGAVEEVLRVAVPGGSWIPRWARSDIDHPAAAIAAGDLVVFAMQAANQDPRVFDDPARFDITRTPNRHVGFGYGKFYCLGAFLSRALLQVAFAGIFDRLPRLRLTGSADDIRLEDSKVTGGLRALPAAWD